MGKSGAHLSIVFSNECWRVKIVWPNGVAHHFGKFDCKLDALKWLVSHRPLVETVVEFPKIRRRRFAELQAGG